MAICHVVVFTWEEVGDIYYLGEGTPGLRAHRGLCSLRIRFCQPNGGAV